MKNIINPYDSSQNMCFGCGIANPMGLKLRFTENDEFLHALWMPSDNYQGYPNVLHGGIIAALLDEIGAWCISVKIGTAGVTSEMKTKYIAPVYINKGEISLTARIETKSEKSATILTCLHDGQQKLCSEAIAVYFLYPPEVAKRRFRYPGREAFYENPGEM